MNHMKKTYSCRNDVAKVIQTSTKPDFNKWKPQLVASIEPTEAKRKAEDRQLELEFKIQHDKFLK